MPSAPSLPPDLDTLATPLAWAQGDGMMTGCNPAFARWPGVGARRLHGVPLAALEFEGDSLARWLAAGVQQEQVRLRRLPLAFPGASSRFADVWLGALEGGGWLLEAHPVDEFTGEDPVAALPSALSAALKGLAHELRNPLAGVTGDAEMQSRRAGDEPGRKSGVSGTTGYIRVDLGGSSIIKKKNKK